jgi:alpha-galactosidase
MKPLVGGETAVALLNRGSFGEDIILKAGDVGWLDTPKQVRNLWTQEEIADFKESLTLRVQPHQTLLLKITG